MNVREEVQTGVAAGVQTALSKLGIDLGASHPIVKAALAAGIDTPEKLSEMLQQAKASKEAPAPAEHPVLKAALAAGIDTAEKFAQLSADANKPSAEENPVLKAALAAGCDSAEKFSQLASEAQAGREALPDARENAHKAAIAYYGTNAEGLAAAKDLIDKETSFKQLNATAERYWAGAPGQDHQGKRLSQPNAQSPQGQRDGTAASNKSKAELAKEESPEGAKFRVMGGGGHDYYAQFNTTPAGAAR